MHSFKQFLTEAKEDKNLHLTHLEDQVLMGGISGTRNAINFLRSLREMLKGNADHPVKITTKWDGAPAIFAGINPENGRFFVGTKSVFNKNAKLNYTLNDIHQNHPNPGLASKLEYALTYLPELGIKNVIQGDMLFTKGDIKAHEIDGEHCITFQPNTILYAVPSNSQLAHSMLTAKMGVVWHTAYHGPSLSSMKASFGVDTSHLRASKNVWYRDATFIDASGAANFTEEETEYFSSLLTHCGYLFQHISPGFLNRLANNETLRIQLMAYNNSKVRSGEGIQDTAHHAQNFLGHIQTVWNKKIESVSSPAAKAKYESEKKEVIDFFRHNMQQLKIVLDMQNALVIAKNFVVRKLNMVQSIGTFLKTADGFKVTAPEGFVAIDHSGNAVKLVDRLTFSHANFTAEKDWTK